MVDRDFLSTFPLGASLHREDRLYCKQEIKKKTVFVNILNYNPR